MSSFEYYSKWALDRYTPYEGCSSGFKDVYNQLESVMESAEGLFRQGYELYTKLSNMEHL